MEAPTRKGQAKEALHESDSPASPKMHSPLPSPSPSLSGSIGALGLSVDSVTLSGPLSYGLPIYDIHRKGRVIFSLRELAKGEVWYTENHNSVRRTSDTHILLGESIELAIPEEEDFDVSRGILTFDGERPFLLEDAQVSAEAEVERLSGMKFYEGIPLSSIEARGDEERGVVVFTLQQLPDGLPFYFDRKSRLTIARTGDDLYTINGKEFQGAVVRQVLPSDSKILDLVFPHDRKEVDVSDEEGEEGGDEEDEGDTPHADILQQILAAASEDSQAEEEEEIARAMLREFDERLKGATLRRAQEKRRRLSAMMKQYTTDPSSPFFLSPSPLSSSSGTVAIGTRTGATRQISTDKTEDEDHGKAKGGLIIPSSASNDAARTGSVEADDEDLLLEDVDLSTPRRERRDESSPDSVEACQQEQEQEREREQEQVNLASSVVEGPVPVQDTRPPQAELEEEY